jgi:hypothetical protein
MGVTLVANKAFGLSAVGPGASRTGPSTAASAAVSWPAFRRLADQDQPLGWEHHVMGPIALGISAGDFALCGGSSPCRHQPVGGYLEFRGRAAQACRIQPAVNRNTHVADRHYRHAKFGHTSPHSLVGVIQRLHSFYFDQSVLKIAYESLTSIVIVYL